MSRTNAETGLQILMGAIVLGALAALAVYALVRMPENCRVQRLAARTLANPRTDQLVQVRDEGAEGLNKTTGAPLGKPRQPNMYRNSDHVNMSMAPMISAFPRSK